MMDETLSEEESFEFGKIQKEAKKEKKLEKIKDKAENDDADFDDDDDDDEEEEENDRFDDDFKINVTDEFNLEEAGLTDSLNSQLVMSNDFVSAMVGTSIKSSESFRNLKFLSTLDENDLLKSQLTDESQLSEKQKKRRFNMLKQLEKILKEDGSLNNSGQVGITGAMGENGQVLNNQGIDILGTDNSMSLSYNYDSKFWSSSYNLDDNLDGTLTLIEEHGEDEEMAKDGHGKQVENSFGKLKRTVMTILLTQRWQKVHKGKRGGRKRQKNMVPLEPTYQMEPLVNLHLIRHSIEKKCQKTFDSLIDKHGIYDTEYTPRFLRIITEMIKNDVKSFKLDRYKIVTQVTILKKVASQSMLFISKMLANYDHDHRICIRSDTKSFYAICLIFLIFHE